MVSLCGDFAMMVNEELQNKLWRVALLVLGLMQVLSGILQIRVHIEESHSRITPEFIVWSMIIFSPILVLVLVRRINFLVAAMAVPIAAIFCGRIHYGLLFLHSKPLPQMGDWAIWLNSFFGLLSLGTFVAWALVRSMVWLGSAIGNFRKGREWLR
jgi:hypothetical protein